MSIIAERMSRLPSRRRRSTRKAASEIDMGRAAPWPLPPGDGDTIWMGAIDAGLAVSYIQSIFWEYGSGCVLPRPAYCCRTAACSFSLDRKERNALAPGKRPMHTLNPPLGVFDDGRVLWYGAMGGDGQPQFQAQVLTRILFPRRFSRDAIDAPRIRYDRAGARKPRRLKLEDRFDPALSRSSRAAGHEIDGEARLDDLFGHAGALMRFGDGRSRARTPAFGQQRGGPVGRAARVSSRNRRRNRPSLAAAGAGLRGASAY